MAIVHSTSEHPWKGRQTNLWTHLNDALITNIDQFKIIISQFVFQLRFQWTLIQSDYRDSISKPINSHIFKIFGFTKENFSFTLFTLSFTRSFIFSSSIAEYQVTNIKWSLAQGTTNHDLNWKLKEDKITKCIKFHAFFFIRQINKFLKIVYIPEWFWNVKTFSVRCFPHIFHFHSSTMNKNLSPDKTHKRKVLKVLRQTTWRRKSFFDAWAWTKKIMFNGAKRRNIKMHRH